jgi:hypothetical protein
MRTSPQALLDAARLADAVLFWPVLASRGGTHRSIGGKDDGVVPTISMRSAEEISFLTPNPPAAEEGDSDKTTMGVDAGSDVNGSDQ